MSAFHDLSELIGALYQGIASDEEWIGALDRFSDHFRSSSLFFGNDSGEPHDVRFVGHRVDPDCVRLIQGPLATPDANPFLAGMASVPIGRAVETSRICGDQKLVRSPLFNIALRPFGYRYVIGALLEQAEQGRAFVAFTRSADAGDYEQEEVERLNLLLPHLTRALHLREEFRAARSGRASAEQALEELPRGLLLLCPETLSILFANREARRILDLRDGLGCNGTRLLVRDRRLEAHILTSSRAAPDSASRPLTAAVPRPSGAPAWRVSVSFLPRSAAGMNGVELPCLALTVLDPEHNAVPHERDLQAIYGLTLAEAGVAARLCSGDLHEVARDLGITYNTAKSHLRMIFDKVGVSSQSSLVRRITLDLAT